MVGVLTMAAAAAPPPVKDYEIEVRSRICQVPFCLCWGVSAWRWWESCLLLGRERSDVLMIHSYNFGRDGCLGVSG